MKIKNFGKIYLQPTTFQKKLELRNNPIERSKLEKKPVISHKSQNILNLLKQP
jgi:uncharacterized protein YgbK (DUF1537 family)